MPSGNASVSVPSSIFLNSLCKHSVGNNKGEVKNDHLGELPNSSNINGYVKQDHQFQVFKVLEPIY